MFLASKHLFDAQNQHQQNFHLLRKLKLTFSSDIEIKFSDIFCPSFDTFHYCIPSAATFLSWKFYRMLLQHFSAQIYESSWYPVLSETMKKMSLKHWV